MKRAIVVFILATLCLTGRTRAQWPPRNSHFAETLGSTLSEGEQPLDQRAIVEWDGRLVAVMRAVDEPDGQGRPRHEDDHQAGKHLEWKPIGEDQPGVIAFRRFDEYVTVEDSAKSPRLALTRDAEKATQWQMEVTRDRLEAARGGKDGDQWKTGYLHTTNLPSKQFWLKVSNDTLTQPGEGAFHFEARVLELSEKKESVFAYHRWWGGK